MEKENFRVRETAAGLWRSVHGARRVRGLRAAGAVGEDVPDSGQLGRLLLWLHTISPGSYSLLAGSWQAYLINSHGSDSPVNSVILLIPHPCSAVAHRPLATYGWLGVDATWLGPGKDVAIVTESRKIRSVARHGVVKTLCGRLCVLAREDVLRRWGGSGCHLECSAGVRSRRARREGGQVGVN